MKKNSVQYIGNNTNTWELLCAVTHASKIKTT